MSRFSVGMTPSSQVSAPFRRGGFKTHIYICQHIISHSIRGVRLSVPPPPPPRPPVHDRLLYTGHSWHSFHLTLSLYASPSARIVYIHPRTSWTTPQPTKKTTTIETNKNRIKKTALYVRVHGKSFSRFGDDLARFTFSDIRSDGWKKKYQISLSRRRCRRGPKAKWWFLALTSPTPLCHFF